MMSKYTKVKIKDEPADTPLALSSDPAAYIDSLLKSNYDITQLRPGMDDSDAEDAEVEESSTSGVVAEGSTIDAVEYTTADDSQDSDTTGIISADSTFLVNAVPPLELVQDKYGRWICNVCEKFFCSKADLKRHYATHSDERPFKCSKCDKRFKFKSHVKEHELIHTQEKKHPCLTCGRAFRRVSDANRHMRICKTGPGQPIIQYKNTAAKVERLATRNSKVVTYQIIPGSQGGATAQGQQIKVIAPNRHQAAKSVNTPPPQRPTIKVVKSSQLQIITTQGQQLPARFIPATGTGNTMKVVTAHAPVSTHVVHTQRRGNQTVKVMMPADAAPGTHIKMKSLLAQPVTPVVITPQTEPELPQIKEEPMETMDTSDVYVKKEPISDEEADTEMGLSAWQAERPFQCQLCQRRFRQERHLESHMIIHTGERTFPCDTCGKKFVTETYVIKHKAICSGVMISEEDAEMDAEEAAGHDTDAEEDAEGMQGHAEGTQGQGLQISNVTTLDGQDDLPRCYPCRFCGKMFKRTHHVREHERIHTNSQKRNFKCGRCDKGFMRRIHLANHIRACTGISKAPNTRIKLPYLSEEDDVTSVVTPDPTCLLPDPDDPDYDPERPFPCRVCDKRFKLKHHLRDHLLVHSSAQKRVHPCPKCGRKFARPSYVNKHVMTCTGYYDGDNPDSSFADDSEDIKPDVEELNKQIMALNSEEGPIIANQESATMAVTSSANQDTVTMTADSIANPSPDNGDAEMKDLAPVSRILSRLHVPGNSGKSYQCDVCQKRFHLPHQLRDHKMTHGRALFQCTKCRRFLLSKASVEKHMLICKSDIEDHGETPYPCYICDKRFRTKSLLREHHTAHVTQKSMQCGNCGKHFSNSTVFARHQRACVLRVDRKEPREIVATYTYPEPEEIARMRAAGLPIKGTVEINPNYLMPPHMRNKPSPGVSTRSSSQNEAIKNEVENTEEPMEEMQVEEDGEIVKEEGEILATSTPVKYRSQGPPVDQFKRGKGLIELGICDSCGEVLVSDKGLTKHYESSDICKPSRCSHKCSICKSQISSAYSLTVHQSLHIGPKYFCCQVCKKLFSTKLCLLYHLNIAHIHKEDMPDWYPWEVTKQHFKQGNKWQCTDCDTAYYSWFALAKHHLSHMGVVLENCDLCGRSYILKDHLVEHQRLHVGETPYQCKVCGFTTCHLRELNNHRAQHPSYEDNSAHAWKCKHCGVCFRPVELRAHEDNCFLRPEQISLAGVTIGTIIGGDDVMETDDVTEGDDDQVQLDLENTKNNSVSEHDEDVESDSVSPSINDATDHDVSGDDDKDNDVSNNDVKDSDVSSGDDNQGEKDAD